MYTHQVYVMFSCFSSFFRLHERRWPYHTSIPGTTYHRTRTRMIGHWSFRARAAHFWPTRYQYNCSTAVRSPTDFGAGTVSQAVKARSPTEVASLPNVRILPWQNGKPVFSGASKTILALSVRGGLGSVKPSNRGLQASSRLVDHSHYILV